MTPLQFIKLFQKQETIEIFTNGLCYWFAFLLKGRFPDGEIMYDEVANHFGCAIAGRVYDITGDITDSYSWESWGDYHLREPLNGARIVRDCVLKETL